MYVIVARFLAQEGKDEEVARLLREMEPLSNQEPGCAQYTVQRSVDDPRLFLLYEQYHDEAAFTAHTETEDFKRLVLGEVVPLLERREREAFWTLDS
ncbi:MAG TPA: putative quinol monooxygenase [Thermomicrobiales bacterium]|nr:putative quinol monooxygenase [Thermomicrobiales bacterium]